MVNGRPERNRSCKQPSAIDLRDHATLPTTSISRQLQLRNHTRTTHNTHISTELSFAYRLEKRTWIFLKITSKRSISFARDCRSYPRRSTCCCTISRARELPQHGRLSSCTDPALSPVCAESCGVVRAKVGAIQAFSPGRCDQRGRQLG